MLHGLDAESAVPLSNQGMRTRWHPSHLLFANAWVRGIQRPGKNFTLVHIRLPLSYRGSGRVRRCHSLWQNKGRQ